MATQTDNFPSFDQALDAPPAKLSFPKFDEALDAPPKLPEFNDALDSPKLAIDQQPSQSPWADNPGARAAQLEQARQAGVKFFNDPNYGRMQGETTGSLLTAGIPFKQLAPSAQTVQDAMSAVESIAPGKHLSDPSEPPSTAAKVFAGSIGSGLGIAETLTSPIGIAATLTGGAPVWLQRLISAGFTVDMLRGAPEQVKQFKDAYENHDLQGATEAGLNLATTAAFVVGSAKHAATSERARLSSNLADVLANSEIVEPTRAQQAAPIEARDTGIVSPAPETLVRPFSSRTSLRGRLQPQENPNDSIQQTTEQAGAGAGSDRPVSVSGDNRQAQVFQSGVPENVPAGTTQENATIAPNAAAEANVVPAEGTVAKPADAAAPISDFERYNQLQQQFRELIKAGKVQSPEMDALMKEQIVIRNRNGDAVPLDPNAPDYAEKKAAQDSAMASKKSATKETAPEPTKSVKPVGTTDYPITASFMDSVFSEYLKTNIAKMTGSTMDDLRREFASKIKNGDALGFIQEINSNSGYEPVRDFANREFYKLEEVMANEEPASENVSATPPATGSLPGKQSQPAFIKSESEQFISDLNSLTDQAKTRKNPSGSVTLQFPLSKEREVGELLRQYGMNVRNNGYSQDFKQAEWEIQPGGTGKELLPAAQRLSKAHSNLKEAEANTARIDAASREAQIQHEESRLRNLATGKRDQATSALSKETRESLTDSEKQRLSIAAAKQSQPVETPANPQPAIAVEGAKPAEVPLGLNRPAKENPALRKLDESSFDNEYRDAKSAVNSAEKLFDAVDEPSDLTDEQRKQIAAAQDRWSSVDLERERRNYSGIHTEDVLRKMIDLADSESDFPRFKVLADILRERGNIKESDAVGVYRLLPERILSNPDFKEALGGKLTKLKAWMQQYALELGKQSTIPEQKYQLKGSGPQTHSLLERLPASEVEIANGEQPVRVRNDRTGKESTVLESDLVPVKPSTGEKRAKIDLDQELTDRKLDPSVFPTAKAKRAAIERHDAINRSGIEGALNEQTPQGNETPIGKTNRSRVVSDLQGSGKVLWGTPDEISKAFTDAYRSDVPHGESTAGGLLRQDLGRNIHSGTQEGTSGVFQQARVFIARGAEGSINANALHSSEVFTHRILFNPDHAPSSDFNLRLANKLPGVKIVFIPMGELEAPALFHPEFNAVVVNTDKVIGIHPLAFDALLTEELIHAATRRLSSRKELSDVWRSLSADEQSKLRRLYDPEGKWSLTESNLGSEYVRIVLQQRLTGRPTEGYSTFWRVTDAIKIELGKLLNFFRETFGAKPTNDIARQVIDRIEGAIRGDAPIQRSVFEGGNDVERSGIEIPQDEAGREGDQVNIAGRTYDVISKNKLTQEQRDKADTDAQNSFQGLGIPGAPDTTVDKRAGSIDNNTVWRVVPDGKNHDDAVKELRDHLILEIQKQNSSGGDPAYVSSLINAINMNFDHGNWRDVVSKPILESLLDVSVGESSRRGTLLRQLRGISEDTRAIAQNADLRLKWTYENSLDPEGSAKGALKRVVEGIKKHFTENEITALALKLSKGDDAAPIVAALRKALTGDFESVSDVIKSVKSALIDAGMNENQANKILAEAQTILGNTIREGARIAIEEMKVALTPEAKRGIVGKAISEIQKLLLNDTFGYGDLLNRLAKEKRWTVPTAHDFEQMREWAKREEMLRTPAPAEIAKQGGNAEAARSIVEAATIDARKELLRKINVQWSQWTKPLISSWRDLGDMEKVKNSNNAFNEWVAANLLLKVGFGTRQVYDVGTQMALNTPTRALAHAWERWNEDKAEGRDTNLLHTIAETFGDAYRSRAKVLVPALHAFKETLKGKGEQRQVEQLISSISIFDRALLNASKMRSEGKRGAANLLEVIAVTTRMGRQFAAATDVIHGIPAETQEIAHQVRNALQERGLGKVATDMQYDSIVGLLTTYRAESLAMARDALESRGIEPTSGAVERASWHILREKIYNSAQQAGLPADEWRKQNAVYRDLIGWNLSEAKGLQAPGGPGGLVSLGGRAAKNMLANVPVLGGPLSVPFAFSNAIGISLNRKLAWSPLGFFPGLFKGSPHWEGETNIKQRKIEAMLGTGIQAMLFTLVATGVWKALPPFWPKDEKERDLWTRNGWKPGMVIIPWGNGLEAHISTSTGPLAYFSPSIAAAAAYTQKMEERAKRQAELNAKAAKNGTKAEQLPDLSMSDWLGIMGSAAYSSVTGGRTASGALSSFSDYGNFNLKKAAASEVSAILPGFPALNEFGRMAGANINPKLASFWDLLVPMPTSGAQRVNMLGDPMKDENDFRRIFQILTGGTDPITKVTPPETQAYATLFSTDFRPPSINPSRGYTIGNQVRPMNSEELNKYTTLRGQQFKQELESLGSNPSTEDVKAAFIRANNRALTAVGVTVPVSRATSAPAGRTRSTSRFRIGVGRSRGGLRGLRSLRGGRNKLRSGFGKRRRKFTLA